MSDPPADPEQEPLANNDQNAGSSDYVEQRKLCMAFSYQCGIIFIGIVIILALIYYIVEFAFLVANDFFYAIYPVVYGLLLLPIALASVIFVFYFLKTNSPHTRRFLPEAILAVSICSFLLALWIFVYICLLDQHNNVYVMKNASIFFEDRLFADQV